MQERSENLPLAGIKVLVTRALEQSAGLVENLTAKGAEVVVIPAVSILPLSEPVGFAHAMDRIGLYEKIVFTSVNGVTYTLELLARKGMGPWDLPPALCVGEKTAIAWEEAGGEVAAVPEQYTAEALLDSLGEDLAGRSFMIMRPEVVKTELGEAMSRRGATVDEVVIYRTVAPEGGAEALGELMTGGGPDVVLFASPSAVEGTINMVGARSQPFDKAQGPEPVEEEPGARREKQVAEPGTRNSSTVAEAMVDRESGILDIPAICIGPTTAKAAEEAGFTEIYFPDEHTAEGMVDELLVIVGALKNRM